jgi:hypothetical protein
MPRVNHFMNQEQLRFDSPFMASFSSLSFKISSGIKFATLRGAGRVLPSPFFAVGRDEDPTNRFLGLAVVVAASGAFDVALPDGPSTGGGGTAVVVSVILCVSLSLMSCILACRQ